MTTQISLDEAGRIVIPKSICETLHLEAGDLLDLESDGGRITLRPTRATNSIYQEDGLWVFGSGQPTDCSIPQLIEEGRAERDRAVLALDR